MAYDLGDVVQLTASVTDASGAPANTGNMALTIMLPDDSTVLVDPVAAASTGSYVYSYATTQPGRHTVRWVGTGANAMAHTDVFDVQEAASIAIVSLARTKAQLNIPASDTSQDDELRGFINGASLAVERQLGTVVARRSFTERCRADAYGQVLLSHVPVLAVTSVQSVDGTSTWTADGLSVDSETGIVTGVPALRGTVDVVSTAGLRIVPEDYQLATLIIIQHLWETQRGRAGAVPGGSDEPEYFSGRGFAIPRRAVELLDTTLPGVA
ncbi:Ig-like domain-containing protein [Streptomyces sp. NPDC006975]|uniref:Ig-like domain-containing protein n=1 Tax=Streptomyces sp. NPDC006975 TaxID=3154310 RepID=UPI0034561165